MTTELLLIRHAPSHPGGRLYGRTDVSADLADIAKITGIRCAAGVVDQWISSPASRCQQTLAAIWGGEITVEFDARLWEQDFGDWENLAHQEIPDQGNLAPNELASFCPPNGESFKDVCDRVQPALLELAQQNDGDRVAIVAHAGVVRAALALTLGTPAAALSFEVQPLSLTKIRIHSENSFSVVCTNWSPACP